jgi:spore coat polysaccharide biosynthesis protein SpsF
MTTVRPGMILQARMASTRLPGKALKRIGKRTLLEHCLVRLTMSGAAQVVLATTRNAEDDPLEALAAQFGVPVFRGSVGDVLGRYVAAATAFSLDPIIRATADNPAVDVSAPVRVLEALARGDADYVREDGLPLGACVEGITFAALRCASAEATLSADREHVTTYVHRHPERFATVALAAPAHLHAPHISLTVDTPGDLDRVRGVFARTGTDLPTLDQLIHAAQAMEAA